jgi:ergothioneine biosynthesis protein EgtB
VAAASGIETRSALLDRMARARYVTDNLFGLVKPEFLYERPIPERHRIIFYVGHLEAFDWNLLHPRITNLAAFDASLDKLFAFGIDPVDGGLPSDVPTDWPAVSQVAQYNSRVRKALDEALTEPGIAAPGSGESAELLLNVAIEHRLMHAETLSYMLHQLPYAKKRVFTQTPVPERESVHPEMVAIPSGRAELGLSRGGRVFGWDNEFERHVVSVPPFSIDRYKVSNGEFLEFVQAGCYSDRSLWTEDDWAWKERCGIEHPIFWTRDGSGFKYRGMFEEIPLPLDWPVYVSHAEAAAYAVSKGKRLPAEAEWHRAAYGTAPDETAYPWGDDEPGPETGYFDMQRWDPAPVNAFPAGCSNWGIEGMLASGWEWTSSRFTPFPGFQPFPFYPGYSADFFDGKHYVLKGGSPRTDRSMLRRSFRNWFQPHYPYVYAGFRCAEN